MSGELIAEGDPPEHLHELPRVPSIRRSLVRADGEVVETDWELINAISWCPGCHGWFVSREDPEGWGRTVVWVRLRWWHRRAWAKLRALRAAAEGGVAP